MYTYVCMCVYMFVCICVYIMVCVCIHIHTRPKYSREVTHSSIYVKLPHFNVGNYLENIFIYRPL